MGVLAKELLELCLYLYQSQAIMIDRIIKAIVVIDCEILFNRNINRNRNSLFVRKVINKIK